MTQNPLFRREDFQTIRARLDEPRRFLQVVSGPRQVGKTTVVSQVMGSMNRPVVFTSADEPILDDPWCGGHPCAGVTTMERAPQIHATRQVAEEDAREVG